MIYSTEHNTHTQQESGLGYSSVKKHWLRGLPWWASGLDSAPTLIREVDPYAAAKTQYSQISS